MACPALFLYLITFSLTSALHPMHVSVTEIEMDEKDKRLEIMMRIFVDDLEVTLRESLKQPTLDILSPKGQTLDQMMEPYLRSHFRVALDNKPQTVKYLGHEKENEAFIFYIEVDKVRKWKVIQVQNDIITEIYGDQSNLVHVTWNETIRSLRLTRTNPIDKLTFDDH
ncbi:MAG TPA: DUF6702 family protein [Chryseolinea sp.]|nr:DUF6702 family protein [Chryseolinea sp.]